MPNDSNFVMDGVVFSDHTPNPGLLEYKKAIEPVQILGGDSETVDIVNRYDHVGLDHLKCEWTLVGNGFTKAGGEVVLPKGVLPGATAQLKIEGLSEIPNGECYLELVFSLRETCNWAKSGHEIASGQIKLTAPTTLQKLKEISSPTAPQYKKVSPHLLEITGSTGTTWKFNVVHGVLSSWQKAGGQELIHTPPVLDFYRPITDNDRPHDGETWLYTYLHQTKPHVRSVTWASDTNAVTIVVELRIAPPVLEWSIDTTMTYTFTSHHVSIKVTGKPQGVNAPSTLARIGLTLSLNSIETVKWFGRGPGESYSDKKLSQRIGTWSSSVDDLYTDYEYPQESGNRTDVRWVELKGASGTGLKASFGELEGASFSALHYSTKDIDECTHPYELYKKKKEECVIRLDWAHHGLGTGSCGPKTLKEYELRNEAFEYEVLLE